MTKILVAGWFSFVGGHATGGDLLARDAACEWLRHASRDYDIAVAPPFCGGVDWSVVDPGAYSHVVFVCGPFERRDDVELPFLVCFEGRKLIGLDLSMRVPLQVWNPFDVLFERDSSRQANPDIVFLSRSTPVPIVGVCLVEDYDGGETDAANEAIRQLVSANEAAIVNIDTRLDVNNCGLRTPLEIECLIARVDVLVTTRLHGLVLALKNGVPAIVIDVERGGAKVRRQAETIGWPLIFNVDDVDQNELQRAFDYCLTREAKQEAERCATRAIARVKEIREAFIRVFGPV